jgi:NADH:ubiquinone oxidoreductase subunit 6 (subunit J)
MELFTILEILQLICNLMVGLSANPIHSVLYLILTYLFSSLSIIMNNGNTFIGLMIIIIYIGAVSILFLFSILLLDLRSASLYTSRKAIGLTLIGIMTLFYSEIIWLLNDPLDFTMVEDSTDIYIDWSSLYSSRHDIEIIAHLLYNEYFMPLIVAAITLLVALVGAITISLSGATRLRRQLTNQQLARQSSSFLRSKV